MHLKTSLGLWSAAFFASLGLSPLTACGGSTDAGSTRSGQDGGFGGGASSTCPNPQPQLGPDGNPNGFVTCESGGIHRVEKKDCVSSAPRPGIQCGASPEGGVTYTGSCQTDADCTQEANGWCASGEGGCYCNYGCTRDEDCGAGQICLCGDPVGRCVNAGCTLDSVCGSSSLCLSYEENPGCGGAAFACQTPEDGCVGNGDCESNYCALVNGTHQCTTAQCVIGRPFLVFGEARLADTASRDDWCSPLAPRVDGLDAEARAILGARWTEIALMEHASIAAFARFALELLSLGAPPELVVRTHQAMADETVHARDAFALASTYLGRAVGPGTLDTRSALEGRSPLEIVRTAILEGCIGETVAAVEAAEALAHATDPAVRQALARVTQDETQHAELAWRFVQWALDHGSDDLREATARELLAIVEEASVSERSPGSVPKAVLRAHGLVPTSIRSEIRARVIAEVIAPCARAVVAKSMREYERERRTRASQVAAS